MDWNIWTVFQGNKCYKGRSRGWAKKKFPSIFAYSANNVGLRSLWHLDELFLTKFPLEWCIVCICSLPGSGNIYENVFSVKFQFLRICNFFHEKKKKKTNSSNSSKSFFAMAAKKRCDSIAIFYGGSIYNKLQWNHIFSWLPSQKMTCCHLTIFFLFFFSWKKLQICENCNLMETHFYRYFRNQISYKYIQYIILKQI